MQERLLGFDARLPWEQFEHLWDARRRERFLLKVDARSPLSVDTLVWPSAFDSGQGIGLPASERERLYLAGLPLPDYTGPNYGLWEKAGELLAFLKGQWTGQFPWELVAISWIPGTELVGEEQGPYPAHPSPAEIDPGWERLGYDVADGSRLSGLTNCGYSRGEAGVLRPHWEPWLNDNHLFSEPLHALQFCEITNQRVPEHAPFWTYVIYRLAPHI